MEERRENVPWPTNGWESASPESQGMDADVLMGLHAYIQEQGLPIYAMLIARHGWLVFEEYYRGQMADDAQAIRSCTKSVFSALVGIALCKDSLHALDKTLPDLFDDKYIVRSDGQKRAITLRYVLTMTSGIDNLAGGRFRFEEYNNYVQAVWEASLFAPPGQAFRYGDPPVEVLTRLLEQKLGVDLLAFASEQLLHPLGIVTESQSRFLWETLPDGRYRGAAGLHLTPRDMAKFGYLYLHEGYWEGRQVIPKAYAQASVRVQNAGGLPEESAYGFLWWVTTLGAYNAFFAAGIGGQYIFVVPEVHLVVVIASEDVRRSGAPQKELMSRFVLPAIIG